ncbi:MULTISPECIES: Fpg/Nei family DNA glycosylase [Olivibacter]|uniref:Fpg/Nei family DNA glycosylase n=1 Tax=Olivibacter jilunii TaxID=985016 RepID=A0ABW6AYX1_9SPHI|nr:Fpg/Nei family DNA glycosylase [Olivibacter sp. UJ_SKK_5.1]MDX3913229.1 DNA-formamidopyrimidine glycosylase family protein [Pseudosphingobacterium sp.]
MPELPDLEVFSRNLTRILKGKKLERIHVHEHKKVSVPEKELKEALEKRELKKVYRLGKQLYFDFGKNTLLSLHLMLHGKLVYTNEENPKYALLSLKFEKAQTLFITDFQKMAHIQLNPKRTASVDALSDDLHVERLYMILQNSKAIIKTLLMDQHIIGGIGNAYADEILWEAKIAPQSIANKIPKEKVSELVESIKEVLLQAEKMILKEHPDIISGEIRDFMKVHRVKAKEDPQGNPIRTEKIGGRTTYFTDRQHVYA